MGCQENSLDVQDSPEELTDERKTTGISGFAFQGTNAHVILRSLPGSSHRVPAGMSSSSKTLSCRTVMDLNITTAAQQPM